MLMAASFVRPDIALVLVDLAQNFALALKQMALLNNRNGVPNPRLH